MAHLNLPTEIIKKGESWFPKFQVLKADGTAKDISPAAIDVEMRVRRKDTTGSPQITKKKSVAGETQYPTGETGTNGVLSFLVSQTETNALVAGGYYEVEILLTDTSVTPSFKEVIGSGIVKVEAMETS